MDGLFSQSTQTTWSEGKLQEIRRIGNAERTWSGSSREELFLTKTLWGTAEQTVLNSAEGSTRLYK